MPISNTKEKLWTRKMRTIDLPYNKRLVLQDVVTGYAGHSKVVQVHQEEGYLVSGHPERE